MKQINSISFSGAGWNYVFHAGVALRLIREGCFNTQLKSHGASAGGLISLALLNHVDGVLNMADATAISAKHLDEVTYFNPLPLQTNLGALAEKFVDEWLSFDKDTYKRVNGRIFISLTDFPAKGKIVSQFKSNQDLKDALMTSCYVPYVLAKPKNLFAGMLSYDGAFTNDYWKFDKDTVTVGIPKFGVTKKDFKFDIQPGFHLHILSMFVPWPGHTKAGLFGHGYQVAENWLKSQT